MNPETIMRPYAAMKRDSMKHVRPARALDRKDRAPGEIELVTE